MNKIEDIVIMFGSLNSCAICDKKPKYIVENLSVGTRVFCSEECYANYMGLLVRGNGYYGLEKIE
tara:strand:- start:11 stop:205 length:195 start_codon:yes stop_codon:yes gene_type:complete